MEDKARRYWALVKLIKWLRRQGLALYYDLPAVKRLFPPEWTSDEPILVARYRLIATILPGIKRELAGLKKQLQDSEEYRYLTTLPPASPHDDVIIAKAARKADAPEFIIEFVLGKPCTPEQMEEVVGWLIGYFSAIRLPKPDL